MTTSRPGTTRLMLAILGLVLVGSALVAVLWDALNVLLGGVFDARRLLIALPVAIVFIVLLRYMARTIEAWHAPPGR